MEHIIKWRVEGCERLWKGGKNVRFGYLGAKECYATRFGKNGMLQLLVT